MMMMVVMMMMMMMMVVVVVMMAIIMITVPVYRRCLARTMVRRSHGDNDDNGNCMCTSVWPEPGSEERSHDNNDDHDNDNDNCVQEVFGQHQGQKKETMMIMMITIMITITVYRRFLARTRVRRSPSRRRAGQAGTRTTTSATCLPIPPQRQGQSCTAVLLS